jgi:hypothetical protein
VAGPPEEPWNAALSGQGLFGGDALLDRLERWAADSRVDEAARQRSRERWLRQQAEEEATLAGVLLDLAERRVPVVVLTRAGRRHNGLVRAIGADFCALRTATGADVVVALAALGAVRTQPRVEVSIGDRPAQVDLLLSEVLMGLAATRERVLIVTMDGADAVSGELRSVGHDVVTVRADGDQPAAAYIPLAAIAEVTMA